ncbi:hypothetical protein ACJJTC_012330 [Scirpophaga incertulas]
MVDLEDELECMPVALYCLPGDWVLRKRKKKDSCLPPASTSASAVASAAASASVSASASADDGYAEWLRQRNEHKKYFTIDSLKTAPTGISNKPKPRDREPRSNPAPMVDSSVQTFATSALAGSSSTSSLIQKVEDSKIKTKAQNDSERTEQGNADEATSVHSGTSPLVLTLESYSRLCTNMGKLTGATESDDLDLVEIRSDTAVVDFADDSDRDEPLQIDEAEAGAEAEARRGRRRRRRR